MIFYDPRTVPLSLTGLSCELMCNHCKGNYLKAMQSPKQVLSQKSFNAQSFLISGGFTKEGYLPLAENRELLLKLKNAKLNVHPGFLRSEDLLVLKELDAVVSFDFTQDEKVVKEIYHLPYSPADYLLQYRTLIKNGLTVVPHICLGLGNFDEKTLAVVAEINPEKVVLLIFRPTRKTPLQSKTPPAIYDLEKLWFKFRRDYSGKIILGCMRPGGLYRRQVDSLALEAGFDGIVKPTPALKAKLGEVKTIKQCCAF